MTNTIAKRQNGNSTASFGNVFDNIFQNSLHRFFDDNFWDAESSQLTGKVPVNVRETDQNYEMDVIVPGCKKEDFNIKIEDNLLTISFEQKKDSQEGKESAGWVRNEFLQQSFSRSFTLDDTVDVNRIHGSYTDGILRLILPKNEKAKKVSRRIEIK
jgi:HSP20 family protein